MKDEKIIKMLSDRLEVICATISFSKFDSREEIQEFYDTSARDIIEALKGMFKEE
jgi:hypothetical protein